MPVATSKYLIADVCRMVLNSMAMPMRLEHAERKVLESIAEHGYEKAELGDFERGDLQSFLYNYDRDDSYVWEYLTKKGKGNAMKLLSKQPGFYDINCHPELIKFIWLYVVQEIAKELTK